MTSERDAAIETVAKRLTSELGLDFADAMCEAATAVWLVERRPAIDVATYGWGGVAYHAYLKAAAHERRLRGSAEVRRSDGSREWTNRHQQWPDDLDVGGVVESPLDRLATHDEVRRVLELVRRSIESMPGGAAWGWVVTAKSEGFHSVEDLMEWSGEDRGTCKAAWQRFDYHRRKVIA